MNTGCSSRALTARRTPALMDAAKHPSHATICTEGEHVQAVPRTMLQLIGVACMLIAAKYEEVRHLICTGRSSLATRL